MNICVVYVHMYSCTCMCIRYIMLKLLQLYQGQQCCLKFKKNTQVHARGVSYFKHPRTLTHSAERLETVVTSAHTYLPLVTTAEIKLGNNHANILLSLLLVQTEFFSCAIQFIISIFYYTHRKLLLQEVVLCHYEF